MAPTWVNTSLDLNIGPLSLRHAEVTPKREIEGGSDLTGLEQKPQVKEETGALVEELSRMNNENKKLTEMITILCQNYTALHNHLTDLMSKNLEKEIASSKKRKAESEDYCNLIGLAGATESSSSEEESCKRTKESFKTSISRAYFQTDACDTSLVVKDGYQWRKYGQKVTRDNPSPRAYFRCSFAPSCTVKKKVQRSAEDPSVLVATYDGEHNHIPPNLKNELPLGSSRGSNFGPVAASTPLRASGPSVTLDLIQSATHDNAKKTVQERETPAIQQLLVQQMATSLTRDPNFTAALVAAVSGRFNHSRIERS